jgi:hypothetical protein
MFRFLMGGFVIAHGLVTIAIWSPNPKSGDPAAPMDTSHSWLFGDARSLALIIAVAAGIAIAIAGIAFLANLQRWPLAALISGGSSLLLFGLFFTPWWLAGIAISSGLVVAALRADALTR